jgi:predicted porin
VWYSQLQAATAAVNFQSAAFVINYAFNKNVDIYSGVNYNDIHGGYLAGQQVTSQITGTTGLRLKF